MNDIKPGRVHVIAGGFPPGALAGHDMDYARLRLLELLEERGCSPRWETTSPTSSGGCPIPSP